MKGSTGLIALLGLLLLAFALRLFLLDGQSIWWDEGISLHLATSDLSTLFNDRLDNIHPPLYFLLLKGWVTLTGLSAFSARYFSVLAGWLLVALTYAVGARWFGRRTGLAAAFLCTISAVSVIYAQEIRVYSLLPLAYLALLAVTRELTRPDASSSRKGWIPWAALGLISWTALHLHYVSLFAVGYVTLWAGLSFLHGRRWREFWRLVIVQFLVLLASLPWFLAALFNWQAISGEANAGTFVTDAVPLRFLLAQVWTFHLTGLAGALSRPGIEVAAGITALLMLLLLLLRLIDRRTRRSTAVLLAHWLIPLSSALLVWLVRSFSHPRYVAMFVPGLILLAAYLILPDTGRPRSGPLPVLSRATALILLVLLSALSLWGLALYYFDGQVAKDDIRSVARYLEGAAGADDLILVPDTDWSLPFEYQGPARVAMPGLDKEGDYWANLAQLTAATPRVFVLDYKRGTRDWQNVLPFALHSSGIFLEEVEIDDLLLQVYDLQQPVSAPDLEPLSEQFGPLRLEGVWIEPDAAAGDALAVALQWQMADGVDKPAVHVALRLLDGNGGGGVGVRELSTTDDRLLDPAGRPSDQWRPSQRVTTFHLLPLPPATPPLEYTIAVEVYEEDAGQIRPFDLLDDQGAPKGQEYLIHNVQTTRGERSAAEKVTTLPNSVLAEAVEFAQGLVLQDAAFSSQDISAGRPFTVGLLWQAEKTLPDLRPQLLLLQDGVLLAAADLAPSGGRYPTSLWEVGEQVFEERELLPPPDSAGRAELFLELADQKVSLGEVTIKAQDFNFDRPQMGRELDVQFGDLARLVGFDLAEGSYSAAGTVPLTLLWESLSDGDAGDYVVFTHFLAEDGRLVAQHDGVPGQGARPVSGWVPGEFVLDPHDLVFRDPAFEGTVRVEVGLYDPQSGERVGLQDGSDRYLLPVELEIENSK
jgi:4-amino-4-deoxy-L-arabinose transferase-like glycosyltransferase